MLLVLAIVALWLSPDRTAALDAFWRLVLSIAIYYGLANAGSSSLSLRRLGLALALGGAVLAVVTLLGTRWEAVRLLSLPGLYGRLPELPLDPQGNQPFNPRVVAMGLSTLFPVCLALALLAHNRQVRLVAGLSALVMAVVLPLTQSVQAILGIGCALLFLAICWSRWSLLSLALCAGLLAGFLARYDLRPLAARLLSIDDVAGIGVALRMDMWSRALAMLRDMPFTGIGLNAFPLIQSNFYPGYLIGPEPHAHNLYLQLALDLGLPGVILFMWLLITASIMAVRAYRRQSGRDERALVIAVLAGIVSYLGAGLIDTPWATKPGILLFVLLGCLAATYRLASASVAAPEHVSRRWRWVTILGWAVPPILLGLALLASPGVRDLNLGALEGHRVVLAGRAGQPIPQNTLASAVAHLKEAEVMGAESPGLYSLLGSLYAWQGDYAAALGAWQRQVELDGRDPVGNHVPYAALRCRILGEPLPDNWQELYKVYSAWMARFPGRAESYLWAALVESRFQAKPGAATGTLKTALDRHAQPAGVIEYLQSQLGH
jgi:putative inorganic carbon (HCO3(-)) transporter